MLEFNDPIARARRSGLRALKRARKLYLSLRAPAPKGYGLSHVAAWKLSSPERTLARRFYRKAARMARTRYPAGRVMETAGMVRKPDGSGWTPGPKP